MDTISRRTAIAVSALSVIGGITSASSSAEETVSPKPTRDTSHTAEPFPVIAYRKDQQQRVENAVTRFSKRFGIKATLIQTDNPRCCVWFELLGSANPGIDGWFFVHDRGGSLCYATNQSQLDAAVTALIAIADQKANNGQLPIGLSTSLPVNPIA